VARLARHPLAFCLLLAAALVAARLAIIDYQFFVPITVPPHDMYQGAAFFGTNVHALRLEGDLAWWNPIGNFGYAQYYQSFLSPLAPTCGHIVFVLWVLGVRALEAVGIVLPEYPQYLAITYVVLPVLAFASFLWLCASLFRSRAAVMLAGIVYAFSGIGLWHSAWFYFQEPFSMYFLIAAVVAALRRPTASHLVLVLLAGLVELTSLNYWTLFNAWFVVVVLGLYAGLHWNQVRRAARRLTELWRTRRNAMAVVSVATAVTAGPRARGVPNTC
jgi:hypothetical protein